jgi:hypothetical protein
MPPTGAVGAPRVLCSEDRDAHAVLATTRRDADVVPGRSIPKIASKVTRQDTKAARGGVFMAFDLLRAVVDDDQAKAELWRECQKEFAP